jgi:hypothetical protein
VVEVVGVEVGVVGVEVGVVGVVISGSDISDQEAVPRFCNLMEISDLVG